MCIEFDYCPIYQVNYPSCVQFESESLLRIAAVCSQIAIPNSAVRPELNAPVQLLANCQVATLIESFSRCYHFKFIVFYSDKISPHSVKTITVRFDFETISMLCHFLIENIHVTPGYSITLNINVT
jgi:hypothetical protein